MDGAGRSCGCDNTACPCQHCRDDNSRHYTAPFYGYAFSHPCLKPLLQDFHTPPKLASGKCSSALGISVCKLNANYWRALNPTSPGPAAVTLCATPAPGTTAPGTGALASWPRCLPAERASSRAVCRSRRSYRCFEREGSALGASVSDNRARKVSWREVRSSLPRSAVRASPASRHPNPLRDLPMCMRSRQERDTERRLRGASPAPVLCRPAIADLFFASYRLLTLSPAMTRWAQTLSNSGDGKRQTTFRR
jgi:hypothetical protein